MLIYLTAGTDENYEFSGFAYKVANFPVATDRRLGWTVVEAYIHGLMEASTFIIKNNLYPRVLKFDVCTGSLYILKLIETDYLFDLHSNSWKEPDGKPLFHVPLLKELYYHYLFYKDNGIKWEGLTEVRESEYKEYEKCRNKLDLILKGDKNEEKE